MKFNTARGPFVLFILTLVIFTGIAWFSFQRLNDLINSSKRVTAINETRLELRSLIIYITEAESAQRGYLLAGDSLFLEPYNSAVQMVGRSFIRLRYLLQNQPEQLGLAEELEEKVNARIHFLSRNLQHGQAGNTVTGQQLLKGYLYMKEVRNLSDKMQENVLNTYSGALSMRERYQKITPVLLLVLSLFVLILFTISFLIIRRQLLERIRFQEELEVRIDALNRSNSELEQFAYVASHDLQEPLRKIQAFGDKLVHRQLVSDRDEGLDTVQRMRGAASRMQMLINELLAFSRLSKPEIVMQHEPVPLELILKNVTSDLQMLIQEKKALITVELLPVVEAIHSQMHQLFQNLLANALKFSRSDIRPVIRIYSDLVSGYMIKGSKPSQALQQFHRITVEDNGIGFDPQYQEKIFVIFQRLHGKMEYTGTGIGLAICRKIVANHNGYILAEGKVMNGARFMVYLPVNQQGTV